LLSPYDRFRDNALETISLTLLAMLTTVLTTLPDATTAGATAALALLVYLPIGGFLLSMIAARVQRFYQNLQLARVGVEPGPTGTELEATELKSPHHEKKMCDWKCLQTLLEQHHVHETMSTRFF